MKTCSVLSQLQNQPDRLRYIHTVSSIYNERTIVASKKNRTKLPQIHNVCCCCHVTEIKSRIKFKRETYYNERVTFETYAYILREIYQKYCLYIFFSIFQFISLSPRESMYCVGVRLHVRVYITIHS